MKKLKVIQIGGEHDHAVTVFASLRRQEDLFDVLGYVIPEDDLTCQFEGDRKYFAGSDTDGGAKKHFLDMPRYTLEEALKLPGLEGAVIETGEKKLTKYARIAAEHGLHVHMDKLGSEDGEEFQDLIRYLKVHGNVFSLGYMYRFNPAVRELFAMKERGELGQILYVQAQMNCLHRPEKRDWLRMYKGGMMFFLGCHLIDLILQLQGEPEEVIPCNMCTGLDGARGEKRSFGPYNRYDKMMRAWGEAALGRAPMPVDLDHEAKLHRYILKASGSAGPFQSEC